MLIVWQELDADSRAAFAELSTNISSPLKPKVKRPSSPLSSPKPKKTAAPKKWVDPLEMADAKFTEYLKQWSDELMAREAERIAAFEQEQKAGHKARNKKSNKKHNDVRAAARA